MQSDTIAFSPQIPELESFRLPEGTETVSGGVAQMAALASVVGVAAYTFTFRENSSTPGRFLEQSVVVDVPDGAGYFTTMPYIMGAFTTRDFQYLTERPFGQFYAGVGLRGNNLVCTVRLTDSNADDPIFIQVTGIVVFYR